MQLLLCSSKTASIRIRIVVKFMIDAMHHVAVLLHCPPCCVVQPRNP